MTEDDRASRQAPLERLGNGKLHHTNLTGGARSALNKSAFCGLVTIGAAIAEGSASMQEPTWQPGVCAQEAEDPA